MALSLAATQDGPRWYTSNMQQFTLHSAEHYVMHFQDSSLPNCQDVLIILTSNMQQFSDKIVSVMLIMKMQNAYFKLI